MTNRERPARRSWFLPTLVGLVLAVPIVLGIAGCSSSPAPARRAAPVDPGQAETARFIARNLPRYHEAIDRAIAYLEHFAIDPVELRSYGIKGRKKLVELLDAYVALHRYATGARRGALFEAFGQAVAVVGRPGYHDMGSVDDTQFREDATSYLRACYLMEKMGFDTTDYRREIEKIQPRLDAHFPERGPHQRMAFRFYYRHFGLPTPPVLDEPLRESMIARRLPAEEIKLADAYNLTHEVFVPYDFGGNLTGHVFSDDERSYLRTTLEALAVRYRDEPDVDVLGEILACLRYLGDSDLPVYRDGLELMLSSQRPTGAFGDYEDRRAARGDYVELDLYLHTTSVAMDILPLAFEGPPPR